MVSIPKEVMDVLSASDSAKMLATVDAKGIPNVVPLWSIVAVDSETIAFAEVFIKKTKENLEKNKQVAHCSVQRTNDRLPTKGNIQWFPNKRTNFR